jgi:hypothetical protein
VFKFVFVVALFAVAVYLLVRVIERRGVRRPGDASGPARPAPPPGPVGPDDDPDFIWGLNKKRRHPEHPDDPGPS